jgi:hypothetical protein
MQGIAWGFAKEHANCEVGDGMRPTDADWLRITAEPIAVYDSHDTPSVCRVVEEDSVKLKLDEIEQEFAALQDENYDLKAKFKLAESLFKMYEALSDGMSLEQLDADIQMAVNVNWHDLLMPCGTSEKPTDHEKDDK